MPAKIKSRRQGYSHYRPKGVKAHNFNKVYWPYLPILAVIGGLVSFGLRNGNFNYAIQYGIKGQAYDPQLAVIPFTSQLAAIAVWSVFFAALGTLVFKHLKQIKRSLINGERYIFSHPVLDFGLVTVIALAYLISQTSSYTF